MSTIILSELELVALQKPQGRLQDTAALVVPDSVLTHEHNCREFVDAGIKLAEQAAASAAPIQQVRCRGEYFFFIGSLADVLAQLTALPDIPPCPDPHPDAGWGEDEEELPDWDDED